MFKFFELTHIDMLKIFVMIFAKSCLIVVYGASKLK